MSLLFDLDGEVVDCGSPASLDDLASGAFTVAGWVYRTADNYNQVIAGKGLWATRGWHLISDGQAPFSGDVFGGLRLYVSRSGSPTSYQCQIDSITQDGWTFVACTYDDAASPKVHLFYADPGQLLVEEDTYTQSDAGTGTPVADAVDPFEIGLSGQGGAANNNFDGRIARVGVWNEVLTLTELRQLMYAPVGHWRRSTSVGLWELFDATTVPDLSGRGNDGTVTGATVAPHPPTINPFGWAGAVPSRAAGATIVPVGIATETDTAFGVTASKALAAGLATEADTSFAVTATKALAVGLSTETDSALAVTGAKLFAVGLSLESDSALTITPATGTPVGLATETDTALAVAVAKALAAGLASESDSALAVTGVKAITLSQASETDTALALSALKAVTAGIAIETDAGLAIVATKALAVGLALETDTALSITIADQYVVLFPPHIVNAMARTWRADAEPRTWRADAPARSWRTDSE